MRDVDFIIIGQGIAGTLISYELLKAGKSVLVIDKPGITNASQLAGAIINPFNINTWDLVPKSRQFLPTALTTYRSLEQSVSGAFIQEKPMLIFSKGKYEGAVLESEYIRSLTAEEKDYVTANFYTTPLLLKVGVWQIQTATLLNAWRQMLQNRRLIREEVFDIKALQIKEDGVSYKDIRGKAIICCEGVAAHENLFFSALPFTKNRGDVLFLKIPGLQPSFVYHHKLRLIPTEQKDIFWCGSTYTWRFEDLRPNETWRKNTLAYLHSWLQLPVTVVDHVAAERPTTGGQEPMVGPHPQYPRLYIFNGLGTKGYSMGPYLAKQFCQQLVQPEEKTDKQLVRPLTTWLKR